MLTDVLFPPADQRRTATSLLGWWESRRFLYNVTVGATGIVSLVFVQMIAWLPPSTPLRLGWQPVVAFGVLANVFYTFGWATEWALQRLWREKSPKVGPALFRQGLAFSAGLALLPIAVASIGWVIRVGSIIFRQIA